MILVGRSAPLLEAMLRRDARVELIRARTPLVALGEAATLAQPGSPPPGLVVGPDELVSVAEARAFMEALALAAPGVVALRVAGPVAPVGAEALGGTVMADASPSAVLAALAGRTAPQPTPDPPTPPVVTPPPATATAPAAVPDALDDPAMPPIAAGPAGADTPVVAAMLAGRSIRDAASETLRARTGLANLRIVGAGENDPDSGGPPPDQDVVPVLHRGATLGFIVGLPPSHPDAPLHAAWLAHWLALEAQVAELRRAALTDDLTGAYNRRYFDRFMAGAIEAARRDRRVVALLALDVDNFKSFNDRFGHAAGDSILIELVKLLRSVVRGGDRVCRLGGDELVIVLADPSPQREPGSRHLDKESALISRIRAAVAAHRFPKLGADAPGSLTISGGLALCPWDALTAADLLAAADARLLESKRAGKDRFTLGPTA